MRNSRALACCGLAVALLALGQGAPLPTERSEMIGEGVAWFVPEGVDEGTLPSFTLLEEPEKTGRLPSDWDLRPTFELENGKATATVAIPDGASLYGAGEVLGPLLRNGQEIELWNTDNYKYEAAEGKRLYQSHPWALGLREDGSAFGVIFDSTWKATLKTGDDAIVFASEGPAFRVIVINRDSPQAVMSALANLTGRMPMPPRWALGFQQCRYSYYPDARVREIATEFRARRLPCDVIWLDIHYMDAFRVFTFNDEHFPDPAATNDFLRELGFKSIWMIDPGVKVDSGYFVYDSGSEEDVWVHDKDGQPFVGTVWPGDSVFPDYTRPETRSWWSALYEDFMATGIDGVWNDMNEPSVFDGVNGTMAEDAWHRGGGALPAGPHLRYHNVYGMLMVKASREGILAANPERRPFVLTRSNFLGGQRYAATWTGDNTSTWKDLKRAIPMSLTLGLSGQPFNGPDIGGFAGDADPVLFAHFFALGPFFPFSRAHSELSTNDKEPWAFGPEIEAVAQTALFRRYRLLPYLYTQTARASENGIPIMQPAFFADPVDARLREEQEAFLFGPDLLVVPQWATDPQLPKGNWRAVSLLSGDRENDGYQPTLRLRPGAIVPLGEVVQNTTEESLAPLTLLVSLDADGRAEGALYEDDGDGFDYRSGDFAWSRYEAVREGERVVVRLRERSGDRKVAPRKSVVQLVTDAGVVAGYGDLREGVTLALPNFNSQP